MKVETEIISQFGRARHLKVKIGELEFETPNVITPEGDPPSLSGLGFPTPLSEGSTENFPPADYIPYGTWKREEGEAIILQGGIPESLREYSLVFLPFFRDFYKSPRKALLTIAEIRRRMREDAILYLSFPVSAPEIPLFSYLGVDLFDPFHFRGRAFRVEEKLKRMCEKVRNWIDSGRLRRMLEIYGRTSQHAASLLKLSERELYGYLEMGYPVNKSGKELMTVFEEALERPDVKRYYLRIMNRYSPPKGRKILLLLPCSAKKPYSYSKTHKRIMRNLRGIRGYELVQEVIVTSPLGAVPRELEEVYPAKNYDVPVTGHWSEEEQEIAIEVVSSIIRKGNYERILAYVPEDYYFLESIPGVEMIKGEFLEESSLKKLKEELKEELKEHEGVKGIKEEIAKSILTYQFGDAFSFPEGARVLGKDFRRYRIFLGKEQLAAYDRNRGFFSLTLKGASEILRDGYFVKIDDFIPKGTIFCAGILEADPKIRKGDEVAVYFEEEIRAVGTSLLPGKSLQDSRKGKGIKVRHHVRKEAKRAEEKVIF